MKFNKLVFKQRGGGQIKSDGLILDGQTGKCDVAVRPEEALSLHPRLHTSTFSVCEWRFCWENVMLTSGSVHLIQKTHKANPTPAPRTLTLDS